VINRLTDYQPEQESRFGRSAWDSLSNAKVQEWIEPAEETIRKYPAACLASAFVIGVAIAWWIKRM
jgi:hypothetical protein